MRGIEALRHRRAVVEGQIAVVVAGQRHAHPAALDQIVAKLPRERQSEVLLGDLARDTARARVAAAMARVDHHDRPAACVRSAVDAVVAGGGRSTVRLDWRASPMLQRYRPAAAAPLRLAPTATASAASVTKAAAAPANVVRLPKKLHPTRYPIEPTANLSRQEG